MFCLSRYRLLFVQLRYWIMGSDFLPGYAFECTPRVIPRKRINFERLIFDELIKNLSCCFKMWRFITLFTKVRKWSLFSSRRIQSVTSCHIYFKNYFNIIPSFTSMYAHTISPFQAFETKVLYLCFIFCISATFPTYPTLLALITQIIFFEEYKLRRSSLQISVASC
jgi:hypothetical protein